MNDPMSRADVLDMLEGYRMIVTDPDEYTTEELRSLLDRTMEKS